VKNSTVEFAVHAVSDRIGVGVTGKSGRDDNGEFCELVPTDVHPNEGFHVVLRLGWRTADAAVIFGPFSAGLIARIGHADASAQQMFVTFVSAVVAKRVKVLMRVNGSEVSPLEPGNWPKDWSKLDLMLRLTPFLIDTEDSAQHERLILDLVIPLFGMVVALIGTEENELPTAGELEGEASLVISKRYERSRLNREACIQLKGSRCTICGFDFAEIYGPLGVGYIQVHHVKPSASLGANYRVDIAKDLEPVCANCHAMMHRESPPVTPERLRQLIAERRSTKSS
jgi:5-methylcytosine-specific restriction protein A